MGACAWALGVFRKYHRYRNLRYLFSECLVTRVAVAQALNALG